MLDLKAWIAKVTSDVKSKRSTEIGAWVNLASYTSASNAYTFPSDGYVFTYNAGSTSSVLNIIGSPDGGSTIGIGSINNGRNSLYVRKGMKCYVTGSFSAVRFSPIVGGVVRKLLNTLKTLTSERRWVTC